MHALGKGFVANRQTVPSTFLLSACKSQTRHTAIRPACEGTPALHHAELCALRYSPFAFRNCQASPLIWAAVLYILYFPSPYLSCMQSLTISVCISKAALPPCAEYLNLKKAQSQGAGADPKSHDKRHPLAIPWRRPNRDSPTPRIRRIGGDQTRLHKFSIRYTYLHASLDRGVTLKPDSSTQELGSKVIGGGNDGWTLSAGGSGFPSFTTSQILEEPLALLFRSDQSRPECKQQWLRKQRPCQHMGRRGRRAR